MTDKRKISAITAAVNAYMEGESKAATISRTPPAEISLWKASGRQEMMQMRNLWQRRIVPMR
ncbi:MAG: hypothetical protein R6U37_07595 [Dehalococcoidia bacterium]